MATPETPQTQEQYDAEALERELRYRIRHLLETPLPEEVDACVAELDWRCAVCARMRDLAAQASDAWDFMEAIAEEELLPADDDIYEDIQPLSGPWATDEDVERMIEIDRCFWARPEVQRAYERMAQGLPPFDDDDEC
jgi:hypothetical protein